LVIEHPVKFPERKHPERADQRKERDLVAGKNDSQRDRPKDNRAGETKNKNRARRGGFRCGDALERLGHSDHNPKSSWQRQARKASRFMAETFRDCRPRRSSLISSP